MLWCRYYRAGALTLLTDDCSFEPYSRFEHWFAEHPHPKERLRYLGISKEAISMYVDKLIDEGERSLVKILKHFYGARISSDKSDTKAHKIEEGNERESFV